MSPDEMKIKLVDISAQVAELEKMEYEVCAELGRKLLSEIQEDSEYAPLAARIKLFAGKLAVLRREHSEMETDLTRRLEVLTCFSCKTVNPEGAAFCEDCGAKLGEKPKEYCEACGMMNRPGQKFCGECGAKLPD